MLMNELAIKITPMIESFDCRLWGVELITGKDKLLKVYLDKEHGLTLDLIAKVSKQLGYFLDVESQLEGYILEVSSPGLNRPIFTKEQMILQKGKDISLSLSEIHNGRKKLVGTLVDFLEQDASVAGIAEDTLVMQVKEEEFKVPFSLVEKARVNFDSKRLFK